MAEQKRKSICELVAKEPLVKEIAQKTIEEKVEYSVSYDRINDKLQRVAGPIKGTEYRVRAVLPTTDKALGVVHTHTDGPAEIYIYDFLNALLRTQEKWSCVVAEKTVKCVDFIDKEATRKHLDPFTERFNEAERKLDKFDDTLKEEEKKRGRRIVGRELGELYESLEQQSEEARKKIFSEAEQLAKQKKLSFCEATLE